MSSSAEKQNLSRQEIIDALTQVLYENSTTAVFFHSTIAEQIGLGATEEKTLFILSGYGSLTAGEIAQHTGLTTPSVTNLVDRLESKGFVQRVRDTNDRRRVMVELNQEKMEQLTQVFARLGGVFEGLMEGYNNEELLTITRFIMGATRRSQEAIASLRENAVRKSSD